MIYYRKPASKSIAGDGIRISKPITPVNLAGATEDSQQMALFCWAALPETLAKYPQLKWMFAVPNGGSRHIAEAAKFVATGLRKGVPDIFLPLPIQTEWAKMYAGLFIEMKVGKGKTTENQKEWLEYLEKAGYYCKICYSWIEARETIIKYLECRI